MSRTYTTQIVDATSYEPNGANPGFIEYVVRFTNTLDATDTFDGRIDADGTDMDLVNKSRQFLVDRFPSAPTNSVSPAASFKFEVGPNNVTVIS